MVVDAIDKTGNVPTLVRANNELLGRIGRREKRHYTVAVIICPVLQIIHISSVLSYEGHILNVCISLHSEAEK